MKAKLKERLETITKETKQYLDDKGVTERVSSASQVMGGHFDTVSGARQLKLVEERLELQSKYNDILAQKLDEALKRIAGLEASIKKVA